jgi:hypothetical protein
MRHFPRVPGNPANTLETFDRLVSPATMAMAACGRKRYMRFAARRFCCCEPVTLTPARSILAAI